MSHIRYRGGASAVKRSSIAIKLATYHSHARAAVVITAIIHIVNTAPAGELRQRLERYLEDEFADLERQIAAERSSPDA